MPDPVVSPPFVQAIARNAPHPNAARLFQEWASGQQGQKAMERDTGFVSYRSDVPRTATSVTQPWYKSGKNLWTWDFAGPADPTLRKRYDELVAKYK